MTDTPPPSAPPTSPPPSAPIKRSLLDRFPALARITDKVGAREIPYISQLEYSDCGAACLTMVLHFHGKEVPLSAVRSSINVTRDGVTARAIVDGAGRFGLFARGIKVDVPQVEMLPRGTILHWEFNHFVVFDRVLRGGKLLIVDPAVGTRELSVEEFRQKFTGVAIEVKPTTAFAKEKSKDGNARPYLRELFNESSLLTKIIVVSLVLRLLAMILPLITGRVIDQVVPRSDYSLLWVLIGAIGGMVLFEALGGMIRSHLMIHLRTLLDAKLTLGFLDHMVALPIGFFQKRSSGDLMMRVGSNATMREVVTSQTLSAIIDGVFVLLYAVVIMWVNMAMGLVAMGLADRAPARGRARRGRLRARPVGAGGDGGRPADQPPGAARADRGRAGAGHDAGLGRGGDDEAAGAHRARQRGPGDRAGREPRLPARGRGARPDAAAVPRGVARPDARPGRRGGRGRRGALGDQPRRWGAGAGGFAAAAAPAR